MKRDPSVRLAVENLRSVIPNVAERLSEGQEFITDGPGGKVRGVFKNGDFRVLSRNLSDESIVQPTPEGRAHIGKALRKAGIDDQDIQARLSHFDAAPENLPITIGEGLSAVKWSIESLTPALDGDFMDDLVLLKIAYEFLACHLYTAIYHTSPDLAELRGALAGKSEKCGFYHVDRLHAGRYQPLHGLALEAAHPYVTVHVRLFGWIAFRVHLPRVAFEGWRLIYTCQLDTGEESWARLG